MYPQTDQVFKMEHFFDIKQTNKQTSSQKLAQTPINRGRRIKTTAQ